MPVNSKDGPSETALQEVVPLPVVPDFEEHDQHQGSLQLVMRLKGGDGDDDSGGDDDEDDASMGKLMRTYGIVHTVGESLHMLTSIMSVFLWGLATAGLLIMQDNCDQERTKDTYNDNFGDSNTSMADLCDLVDQTLSVLHLALGPQVVIMTTLVLFTSSQVACYSCCFGDATKKGAAFTYMLFCIVGATLTIFTIIETFVLISDLQEILDDIDSAPDDKEITGKDALKAARENPLITFMIFTSFLTLIMRIVGTVLKVKKHGPCC